MLKKLTFVFATATLLFSGATLSACNTMEGFGQDVENLGEGIEDEAR